MSTVKEWWGCWEVRRAWTLALPLTSYATLINLLPSLGLYFLIHKTGAIVVPTCRVKWVGLCDMTISITSESCFSGKASWRSWALPADSSTQWPEECSWVKAEQPTAQKKVPTVIQIATVQEKVRHHLHALRQMRMLLLNKWSPHPISFIHPSLGLTISRASPSWDPAYLISIATKCQGFSYSLQRNQRKP